MVDDFLVFHVPGKGFPGLASPASSQGLSKAADDTKLTAAADIPESQDAIQRDLDKLKWIHGNLMRFKEAKCKVLHLSWGNPRYQYKLRDEGIESSPKKKDLGLLVDETLDVTLQCAPTAQKADRILGYIKRRVGSMLREVILPLYSCDTPLEVLHPALGSSTQKRHGPEGSNL
ncbi:rna-directed dna polymerase from mobile element jockey-like [Pitangus sulphuratus]|nr:rna-directed dna polymerase from mobile element jockey-like [Pitangus sulphuratus]